MKIAMIQIQSRDSLEENLQKMKSFLVKAKDQGARLAVYPEMAYFTSKKDGVGKILPKYAELCGLFQSWAKEFQIGLIPGTLREPIAQDAERFFNTLLLIGPEGRVLTKYKKIFRFKATLPNHTYDESQFCEAGSEVVTCDFENWTLGFAICFDLRFPELFRSLRKRGARIFILPSAFTVPTGEAHWEVLLRARAIENQSYVIAPDLTLISGEGLSNYGHSMVIDPWGQVLASQKTEEGISIVDLSQEKLAGVETKISAWESRNELLFPIG